MAGIAQSAAELAAAGPDVEKIADHGHTSTDERRDLRHVVGRVDGPGVKLEGIQVGGDRRSRHTGLAATNDRHREL